jgi:membrane fusion protein, copper/silver efflux system
MRKWVAALVVIALMGGAFLAGAWFTGRSAPRSAASPSRQVLYWVDPMHPSYKSDRPGTAPDCGMELRPVYADDVAAGRETGTALPAAAVTVPADRLELIGVRVSAVERKPWTHTLRVAGRVAVDERRIYRINMAVDGWIRETFANTTGGLVEKDEALASFYSPEFLGAEQAYFYALGALERFEQSGATASAEQIALTKANIQTAIDSLTRLGMGRLQIEELARTRKLSQDVLVRAPARTIVLTRNVSPGLRLERGAELYRLADLSRVWIVADIFGAEARHFRPGLTARVTAPQIGAVMHARVSDLLPAFDGTTGTVKLRLEADNPGLVVRPDMLVDVELLVALPPTIAVPASAILDGGVRKTVFVERGTGVFEPRIVETGWRFGDRVEVAEGLTPGDRIVTSGTFLLDSDSRLRLVAAGVSTSVRDPVCGMDVDQTKASATGRKIEHRGTTYYFCSDDCKEKFAKAPERYIGRTGDHRAPTAVSHAGHSH